MNMAEYSFELDESALSAAYEHIIGVYSLDIEEQLHADFAQALSRVYVASNTLECAEVTVPDLDMLSDDIQTALEHALKIFNISQFANLERDLKSSYYYIVEIRYSWFA